MDSRELRNISFPREYRHPYCWIVIRSINARELSWKNSFEEGSSLNSSNFSVSGHACRGSLHA